MMTNILSEANQITGRRLLLVRSVWIISVLIMVGLWLVGLTIMINEPVPDCRQSICDPLEINAGDQRIIQEFNLLSILLNDLFVLNTSIITTAIYFLTGVIIFWQKSNEWFALLTSLLLVFLGARFFTSSDDALLRVYPQFELISDIFYYLGLILLVNYLYLFPDGRFVPRAIKWVAFLLPLGLIIGELIPGLWFLSFLIYIFTAIAAQLFRYFRISTPVEKQQTKWVMLGLAAMFLAMINWLILREYFPPDQPSISRIIALLVSTSIGFSLITFLPISLAISIFRYKLWDIELVVRRTLTYAILSIILMIIFFGSVIFLQSIFANFIGQSTPLVTVVSTLLIAALFNPLRRRVQRAIDRHFSRKKYDPSEVLNSFAATTRDEADLKMITSEMQKIIQKTIEPEKMSFWLNKET